MEDAARSVQTTTPVEVTVIVVSYNTRELTLKALETLFETTRETSIRVVVFDNDSKDGSAEAIAERFPQAELIRSQHNIGFAAANNEVAKEAETEWLLLLNPDTECHEGAVDNLMAFAKANPEGGIFGGRTVFPDNSLNIASCWKKMTVWSLFCSAFGLSAMFPRSSLFNVEAMGGWQRDSVRDVDIVSGCFFLVRRSLWQELSGFDPAYFMYGEEADLCLRAAGKGYRLMITPDAQIMHLVGASTGGLKNIRKAKLVLTAKATLLQDHWSDRIRPTGLFLLKAGVFNRKVAAATAAAVISRFRPHAEHWHEVWRIRHEWISGFSKEAVKQK